jgi:cbb3-type cytochrome c oxidase subunit III
LYNPGFVRINDFQVYSMIRPASSASEHAVTFGQQGDGAAAAGARVRAFQAVAALVVAVLLGIGGTAQAQGAPKKVDLAKGQQIASQACAACHGADGNATGPANPKLAGQHAEYLYKQLVNFVPQPGAKQAERVNAIMMGFASTLSDDDKRNVAAYYSSQVKKPSSAKDKALVELGQQIYRGGIPGKQVPSCAGCHGPAGAGMPAQYPRLAGQWAEYTESQLVQFRGGQRMNSAQMTAISARLSDREIKAVADYVAGLR